MKKGYLIVAALVIAFLNPATVDVARAQNHQTALDIRVVHCEGDFNPLQAYYIALESLRHAPVLAGRFEVSLRQTQVGETTTGRIEVALGSSDLQMALSSVRDYPLKDREAQTKAMGLVELDLAGQIHRWMEEHFPPAAGKNKNRKI